MEFRNPRTEELKARLKNERMRGAADVMAEPCRKTFDEYMAGRLTFQGRNERGGRVWSKEPKSLRMYVADFGSRSWVEIKFSGEQTTRLDGAPAISKRAIKTSMLKGVRMLKHVRESYEQDWARRDAILERVEAINADLDRNGQRMGYGEIEQITDAIKGLLAEIAKDKAMSKRMAHVKLAEIFSHLEGAKYLDGFDKQSHITAACAKLVAFRNRYGTWRNREVAGMMEYNKLRECTLRAERDRRLANMLRHWADEIDEYKFRMAHFWKGDMGKCEMVKRVIALIESGDAAGAKSKMGAVGIMLSTGYSCENEAREDLRNAWRALEKGNTKNAGKWAQSAYDILSSIKPWHVADELEKTGDSYMGLTIKRIRAAVRLLVEKNVVDRSAQLFREAAEKIKQSYS